MSREAVAVESAIVADPAEFDRLDSRVAFGRALGKIAENDPQVMAVVSDYGRRLALDALRSKLPGSVVQCGIAEQNQVEVAAALANEGFHVFAPSYAPFITARVLDQVRVNLGMMRSPVALVGVSAGCESGILGASHMALEDVSLMRGVPNMEVFCPADNAELASVLRLLAAAPRPAYVRTNTLDGANLHPDGTTAAVGRAQRIFSPEGAPEVSLVATGTICSRAVEAARLLAADGVAAEVLEMLTVKPLDVAAVDALAAGGRRLVATVEEHSVVGGLGAAVAERLLEHGGAPALLRLGMPDAYQNADSQAALLERAGLTAAGIAARVRERLRG